MNRIQKIKDSPHYSQLRQSLEYHHCRKQFIVSSIICGVIVVPTVVLLCMGVDGSGAGANMAMTLLLSMFFVGCWIYTAYRWLEIFLHMDDYVFFPAVLTKPIVSHSRYTASVRYSLTFPNMDGQIITRETSSMFHNYNDPCLQDYNGKEVLIGYNEATDRLVVIGRVDC